MSKVELVSKTVGVGEYKDLSAEEIIAAIARHGTIKEDNGRLVKYLMDHKHWSPLTFINFTFKIKTSRSIGRQILRHGSLEGKQEWSQRYSESAEFEPIEIRREHPTNRQSSTDVFDPILPKWGENRKASDVLEAHLNTVENLYLDMLEAGIAKECARDILPGCTTTYMHFNGNLRSWLSFLNVRLEKGTQKEARIIAAAIGEVLEKELPNVMGKIDWRNGIFM